MSVLDRYLIFVCTSKDMWQPYCMIWHVSLFQGFYDEVSSPLLLDVNLHYPDSAVDFLTKNHYSQLFNGSEIVVSGQLMNNDPENFLVEVFAKGVRNGLYVIT